MSLTTNQCFEGACIVCASRFGFDSCYFENCEILVARGTAPNEVTNCYFSNCMIPEQFMSILLAGKNNVVVP